ncbi:MAG: type VI secretion system baseplate subunit TssG [Phycisphaeraceae bacterium]|nr:MAG: type VI secretion system baseplate subunit TssG [Phycisphaeraceae bacterium]
MAGENRASEHPLTERLARAPWEYDYFQAVRRLECEHPHLPRVGWSQRLADDPVRFAQEASAAFAPSTLARFGPRGSSPVPVMTVRFFGFLGPNGPLPIHLTDYVRNRELNAHDPTLTRFLDVFHHRMLSLFYRAWSSGEITVSRDRANEDRFAVYVGSLFGHAFSTLHQRDSLPDEAKLHYAGRLAAQSRNAEGLTAILSDFFQVPVRIVEFVGQWIDLPREYQCRLGESRATGALGRTSIVGSRVWDCQQKFRLVFGPLRLKDYLRFLPGTIGFTRLRDWIRNYLGRMLQWEVQLILRRDEVPSVQLGRDGRLGWTTWLHAQPLNRDPDDLVLQSGDL